MIEGGGEGARALKTNECEWMNARLSTASYHYVCVSQGNEAGGIANGMGAGCARCGCSMGRALI